MLRVLAVALLGSLFAFRAEAQWDRAAPPSWREIPDAAWKEPARPDSGGGDAIILLDETEYLHEDNSYRHEHFRRVRIFTREGRRFGTAEITYLAPRQRLTELRARCVLQNGRSIEWDPAQLVETESFRYGRDIVKRAVVVIPGVEPGCIVEWGYTLSGRCGVFEGASFTLAHAIYTRRSTHHWVSSRLVPGTTPRSWAVSGTHRALVHDTCSPDCKSPLDRTFTMENLPGLQDEALSPPASSTAPTVEVYYGRETSLGYWSLWKRAFDEIQTDLAKNAVEVTELVQRIRAEHPEPDSALAACYRWLQLNVHSTTERTWHQRLEGERPERFSLEDGLDGILHQAESAPFEINCLMAAMAERLGLDASIAFVGDRRLGGFDRERRTFPPLDFMTVVVMKDRSIRYLEPQSRFAPYGSIPWYHRGGSCLLSGKSRDLFRKIPVQGGERASARWTVRMRLEDTGALIGEVEGRLAGEEAADHRRELWQLDPAVWNEWYAQRLAAESSLKLETKVIDVDGEPNRDLVISANGRWPELAATAPDRIAVPVAALVPWRTNFVLPEGPRRQLVFLQNARDETIRLELLLPSGYRIARLPNPQQFENEAGAWRSVWTVGQGAVVWERHLELRKAEVPRSEYATIAELSRTLHDSEQGSLLLTRSP